jgi:hypothetical protein
LLVNKKYFMKIRAVEGARMSVDTRTERQMSGHMDGRTDGESDTISVEESALMVT